jgi:hypothetical protein
VEPWDGARPGTDTKEARLHDLLVTLLTLVPLDATPVATAVQDPVSPTGQGNGFAASIVGGFFALGLIILAAVLICLKPKRHDPRDTPPPRPRPR